MNPSTSSVAASTAQSLPPLNLPSGGSGGPGVSAGSGTQNPMAAIMSGVAPVKMAVDQIMQACKQIVQSGAVPGAEQVCGQIVAMATQLLPMALQGAMGGGMGGAMGAPGAGPGAGPGGLTPPPGPPPGPQPMGGGQ